MRAVASLVLALTCSLSPLVPHAAAQDTTLIVHPRTFYYEGTQNTGSENEAWTLGGWIGYRSPRFRRAFALGGTLYGSVPLYAPADGDGTFLLKPGQEGYLVVGELFAELHFREYAILKGGRQVVTQGYINPSDIRMTPFTFEGVTLAGQIDSVRYLAGYLWSVKQWNSDEFVSMSVKAGADESDAGVAMIGIQMTPLPGLRVEVSEQYGFDTFNTVYAKGDYRFALNDVCQIGIGAEFTDQRAVGDALLTGAATQKWRTRVGAARVQFIYRDLTLTSAYSVTGSGNNIQNPWGTYPGYLALIDAPASLGFARANEKGWLIGAVYDFAKSGANGLVGTVNIASGTGATDPQTSASLPNQTEYNFKVEYRLPWHAMKILRDMSLTVRGAFYDNEGIDELGRQIHVILNWDWGIPTQGRR
jgi:outer membrane porin, OprD family